MRLFLDAGISEEDTFTEKRVLVKFEPHSISGEGIKLRIFSPFKIMIRIQPATVTLLISRRFSDGARKKPFCFMSSHRLN